MDKNEGNKLIAEFMGISCKEEEMYADNSSLRYCHKYIWGFNDEWYDGELGFHESWDWLMPVIEKIENIDIRDNKHDFPKVKFQGDSVEIFAYATHRGTTYYWKKWMDISQNFHYHKNHCESKIEAVYKAVVEFIQWYNTQKQ